MDAARGVVPSRSSGRKRRRSQRLLEAAEEDEDEEEEADDGIDSDGWGGVCPLTAGMSAAAAAAFPAAVALPFPVPASALAAPQARLMDSSIHAAAAAAAPTIHAAASVPTPAAAAASASASASADVVDLTAEDDDIDEPNSRAELARQMNSYYRSIIRDDDDDEYEEEKEHGLEDVEERDTSSVRSANSAQRDAPAAVAAATAVLPSRARLSSISAELAAGRLNTRRARQQGDDDEEEKEEESDGVVALEHVHAMPSESRRVRQRTTRPDRSLYLHQRSLDARARAAWGGGADAPTSASAASRTVAFRSHRWPEDVSASAADAAATFAAAAAAPRAATAAAPPSEAYYYRRGTFGQSDRAAGRLEAANADEQRGLESLLRAAPPYFYPVARPPAAAASAASAAAAASSFGGAAAAPSASMNAWGQPVRSVLELEEQLARQREQLREEQLWMEMSLRRPPRRHTRRALPPAAAAAAPAFQIALRSGGGVAAEQRRHGAEPVGGSNLANRRAAGAVASTAAAAAAGAGASGGSSGANRRSGIGAGASSTFDGGHGHGSLWESALFAEGDDAAAATDNNHGELSAAELRRFWDAHPQSQQWQQQQQQAQQQQRRLYAFAGHPPAPDRFGLATNLARSILFGDWGVMQELAPPPPPPPPPGLTRAQLERFPTSVVTAEQVAAAPEDSCCVCLGEYEAGETTRRLTCLHVFHAHCIGDWLARATTCPLCKIELKPADTS